MGPLVFYFPGPVGMEDLLIVHAVVDPPPVMLRSLCSYTAPGTLCGPLPHITHTQAVHTLFRYPFSALPLPLCRSVPHSSVPPCAGPPPSSPYISAQREFLDQLRMHSTGGNIHTFTKHALSTSSLWAFNSCSRPLNLFPTFVHTCTFRLYYRRPDPPSSHPH